MGDASLLARIESVKGRIQRQDEARRLEADADKIGDRAATLRVAVDTASRAFETSSLLRSEGVEVEWDTALIRSLRDRVSRFAERSRSTPAAILEPNAQLWPRLNEFPDDARQRMLAAWQVWVDNAFPARDEAILTVLQRIPELQDGVRRIRQGLAVRAATRMALPEGRSDFDVVREAAAVTDHAWSELVGGGLPAGVPEFLDAAGTGQATLEQFTDAVHDWFVRKGLRHLIRLSLAHRANPPR